jgi:hypothetical protein
MCEGGLYSLKYIKKEKNKAKKNGIQTPKRVGNAFLNSKMSGHERILALFVFWAFYSILA